MTPDCWLFAWLLSSESMVSSARALHWPSLRRVLFWASAFLTYVIIRILLHWNAADSFPFHYYINDFLYMTISGLLTTWPLLLELSVPVAIVAVVLFGLIGNFCSFPTIKCSELLMTELYFYSVFSSSSVIIYELRRKFRKEVWWEGALLTIMSILLMIPITPLVLVLSSVRWTIPLGSVIWLIWRSLSERRVKK